MPARDLGDRKRGRLVDADLESTLATGEIVGLQLAGGLKPAATLSRGDVLAARGGAANRSAGILLHRILERWDGKSALSPLIAMLAGECAADADAIEKVKRRMTTVGRSAMFQRIVRCETIGREMPIAFVDESGAIVEKRLDRVIREDGIDTVIDYKSGEPTPSRLERDRQQVALYCQAYERLSGRPCRGALWYIDETNDVTVDVTVARSPLAVGR
jgi:hypothetical protein